jgi:hypothetical protein
MDIPRRFPIEGSFQRPAEFIRRRFCACVFKLASAGPAF